MNLLKEASILFSPKTALLAERQLKIRKKTDHYLTIKKTSDEASKTPVFNRLNQSPYIT